MEMQASGWGILRNRVDFTPDPSGACMTTPTSDATGGRISRLIVVSNRLPFDLARMGPGRKPRRNVGGLVNALEPVLAKAAGCWVGWDGFGLPSNVAVAAAVARGRVYRAGNGVEYFGVPLSEREILLYYQGLSNRTLWPVFHNILDKSVFNTEDWLAYERVNRRFAEAVFARADHGDRIWVHDYHLLLVPGYLRELGFRGRIDFFLHIPFPAPEVFLALPWRGQLIDSLLAADAVAFHVAAYRNNFLRSVSRLSADPVAFEEADSPADAVEIRHAAGSTRATVAPIGIDVADFERIAESPGVTRDVARLREAHEGRLLMLGADRLDYTKGILERMLAIEHMLESHPERTGTFAFIQIVVPSRADVDEYRILKREIDEQVGRINGRFGRSGWVPIHYEYRALDRHALVAHYRAANVALVTPLRDGMNLVAPEFIASRTDDDGVLVLSEFAGVAHRLTDAVIVNPYDQEAMARTIETALAMGREDRSRRMRRMREIVRENTLDRWIERCLDVRGGPTPDFRPGLRDARPSEPHPASSAPRRMQYRIQ